jgi:NADPH-dependent glutamate synthase beta subunit-like oxidoreductase
MTVCNRRELDEPVNIRDIERAVAERGIWPQPVRPMRRQRVAVVGSGPAGLSAAYHLARVGFPVTIFEAAAELGGVLRSGIPMYRLPRSILDREIDYVLRHGIEVQTNHPVDRKELAQLRADFAAVFVATGLRKARSLDLGDRCDDVISQALDFLDYVRRSEVTLVGRRVVVVGGGNTALDAARSALRLGAKDVHVVYRRSRTEMPAIAEEIEEAAEEGVAIDELLSPLRLDKSTDGPVLVCRRMRLGDVDESGRRKPVPLEGDDALIEVPCDRLLLALGQEPDLALLPEDAEISESGVVSQAFDGGLLLAGGDLARGEGTVSAAIGSGRMAAARIAASLLGTGSEQATPSNLAGPDVVILDRFPRAPQHRSATLPAAERRTGFAEVRLGLVDDALREEAKRCLSCGACTACDTCVVYCPEGVLFSDGSGHLTFDYDYCKGCGLCATQCPRGVIIMESCSKEASA